MIRYFKNLDNTMRTHQQLVLLASLFTFTTATTQAEIDHDNQAFLYVYDQNLNPILTYDSENTVFIGDWDITDRQNPNNHEPDWSLNPDNDPTHNRIEIYWECGRQKSGPVANTFMQELSLNSDGKAPISPTLGLIDEDQSSTTYYPSELNFWIRFDIQLQLPAPDNRYIWIPKIIMAQTSESDFWQVFLDISIKIYQATNTTIIRNLGSG